MAFDDTKASNMFDGPMALTKERDACGVGFIANTKSGGMFYLRCFQRYTFEDVFSFSVFLFFLIQRSLEPTGLSNRVFLLLHAWNTEVHVEVTPFLVMVRV